MRQSGILDAEDRPIPLYEGDEWEKLRAAGRLAALTLDHVATLIRPGLITAEIDRAVDQFIRARGAVPATVGYNGHLYASCISVNHVVTHGLPSETKKLAEGDIVNVDVTPLLDGFHGDSSRTFLVGKTGVKARRIVQACEEALMAGIAAVKPGAHLGDVGGAIQAVARKYGYSIVADWGGHGTGLVFHDAPFVSHVADAGTGPVLAPGMVFTIEPMMNAGTPEVTLLNDGWTVVTKDRNLSAQFEHTIGVTGTGAEIFTRAD